MDFQSSTESSLLYQQETDSNINEFNELNLSFEEVSLNGTSLNENKMLLEDISLEDISFKENEILKISFDKLSFIEQSEIQEPSLKKIRYSGNKSSERTNVSLSTNPKSISLQNLSSTDSNNSGSSVNEAELSLDTLNVTYSLRIPSVYFVKLPDVTNDLDKENCNDFNETSRRNKNNKKIAQLKLVKNKNVLLNKEKEVTTEILKSVDLNKINKNALGAALRNKVDINPSSNSMKKYKCPYCGKLCSGKITNHLFVHKDKDAVRKIMSLPPAKRVKGVPLNELQKERKKVIASLRNKGAFLQNCEADEADEI